MYWYHNLYRSCLIAGFLWLGICQVPAVTEIPIEYHDGMIWLQVDCDAAKAPLNFLLDSGARVSVVDLRAAREMKLWRGLRVRVRGVAAETTGYWPTRWKATVRGLTLPRQVLSLDLTALSRACHRPVHGLVGADFFRERLVQIDYRQQCLRLLETLPDATEILPLRTDGNIMLAPVSTGGGAAGWFRVDTGCAMGMHRAGSGDQSATAGPMLSVGLAPVRSARANLSVRLGTLELSGVTAGLHPQPLFPGEAGLLGNGLLERFVVTFDFTGKRLALEPGADR